MIVNKSKNITKKLKNKQTILLQRNVQYFNEINGVDDEENE